MKQKDIALIIAFAGFSAVFAFVLAGILFPSGNNRVMQVKVVDSLTSNFAKPDSKYFNESSINPTQTIRIGDSDNTKPFSGSQPQ